MVPRKIWYSTQDLLQDLSQSFRAFCFNFSQGSYNKIINHKIILYNKFMKRKLCQNLQFVIRSELKKHSLFPYLLYSKEEHLKTYFR